MSLRGSSRPAKRQGGISFAEDSLWIGQLGFISRPTSLDAAT
jgi:hypothetical protein